MRIGEVPVYLLPGPIAIVGAFVADPVGLLQALASTLFVTFAALLVAAVLGGGDGGGDVGQPAGAGGDPALGGGAAGDAAAGDRAADHHLGRASRSSRWWSAPRSSRSSRCSPTPRPAWRRAPPELDDLFRLYGAGRWRTMALLRLPAALPYFLSGLRISGGLALVGAVVAELVAGSGGFASGLAYRILEASFRLEMPRMFAALVLLALAGILIEFRPGRAGPGDPAAARAGMNRLLIFGLGYSGSAIADAARGGRLSRSPARRARDRTAASASMRRSRRSRSATHLLTTAAPG